MFLNGADATCFSMSQNLKIPTVRDIFYIITRLCSLPPHQPHHSHTCTCTQIQSLPLLHLWGVFWPILFCPVLFYSFIWKGYDPPNSNRCLKRMPYSHTWRKHFLITLGITTSHYLPCLQIHLHLWLFNWRRKISSEIWKENSQKLTRWPNRARL